MTTDTSQTIEFKNAPMKLVGLSAMGLVMSGLCLAILTGAVPGLKPEGIKLLLVLAGTVFFGAGALVALWRAVFDRGPVLTLSPEGILDRRISAIRLAWSDVRGIGTWSYRRQRVMVLDVAPEVEAGLGLSALVRWGQLANRRLGADGLCINVAGLNLSYDRLLEITLAYAQAAQDRSEATRKDPDLGAKDQADTAKVGQRAQISPPS
jgi:hypothetical protein